VVQHAPPPGRSEVPRGRLTDASTVTRARCRRVAAVLLPERVYAPLAQSKARASVVPVIARTDLFMPGGSLRPPPRTAVNNP
jgi:hypothetical protein